MDATVSVNSVIAELAPGAPAARVVLRSVLAQTEPQAERIAARDLPRIEADIVDLEARAGEGNAFHSAAFLLAAARHLPAPAAPDVLAVWRMAGAPARPRLIGLLPLARAGFDLAGAVARGWRHPFAGFGGPLIESGAETTFFSAVFDYFRRQTAPPSALALHGVAVDGPTMAGLRAAVRLQRGQMELIESHRRAALTIPPPEAADARRAKERRRQRRRLAEKGVLTFRLTGDYGPARAGLEAFLALEAQGWKGARGTALVQDPAHAAFVRAMAWRAAGRGQFRVALMELDGAPVAAALLLTAGRRGFLWKIAYDEAYAAHSPGVLLVCDIGAALAREGDLDLVDSCAVAGHAMIEQLWDGRVAIADVMIGLQRAGAPAYQAAVARERLRRGARARLKAAYVRMRAFLAA